MKTIHYNTRRRTRRETFPDGSQLVRRADGGYEIIEAQPRYGVGDREAPSRQRAGERKGDGTSPPAGGRVKGQGTDRHSKMKLPFRWEGLGLLRNDANI